MHVRWALTDPLVSYTPRRWSAGNAGQPKHGGLNGYGPENALRGTGMWGGRPDADGEIWLGGEFVTKTVVDCAALSQGSSEHVVCTYQTEQNTREARRGCIGITSSSPQQCTGTRSLTAGCTARVWDGGLQRACDWSGATRRRGRRCPRCMTWSPTERRWCAHRGWRRSPAASPRAVRRCPWRSWRKWTRVTFYDARHTSASMLQFSTERRGRSK